MRSVLRICSILVLASALLPGALAHAADKPSCDRACLGDAVDKVLQAMMDHDPSRASLGPGVRYTENGQALAPGEGLWKTAAAIAMADDGLSTLGRNSSAYRLYFADPATGQGAYFGAFTENDWPGMMMLRVRVAAGAVTEIEAVTVRKGAPGPADVPARPGLKAEFTPKGFDEPEPTLLAGGERWAPNIMAVAANRYFDGMEKGSSAGVPLGADCVRRDNGVRTAGAPEASPPSLGCAAQLDGGGFGSISLVRRRILVVDQDRGLVMAVAMIDHRTPAPPSNKKTGKRAAASPPPPTLSTDLMGVIFKMSEGKITRIEAIARPVPTDMSSGWVN